MRVKDAVGRFGEDTAASHLTAAGLCILERNWRPTQSAVTGVTGVRGELDIVAREGNALIIVEVKTRSGSGFGAPAAAITADKTRRIRRLTVLWLAAHPRPAGGGYAAVRFDVVSVLRRPDGVRVEHLRGAF